MRVGMVHLWLSYDEGIVKIRKSEGTKEKEYTMRVCICV